MFQYVKSVLYDIRPTYWIVYAIVVFIILFSDSLWNYLHRRAGKNCCIRVPLWDKLSLIYMVFILLVTLFIREVGSGGRLAWMPLWSWKMVLQHHNLWLLWQILLNILLFVPLGCLMALKCGRSAKVMVLIGFGISLCIELCQLVFRLGLFEWDDILHNGAGSALGVAVVRICKVSVKNKKLEIWKL